MHRIDIYFQIVVVPDNSTAENVPEVPGLLEYRKDTKKLYLRANETWREIAPEKKVHEYFFEVQFNNCIKGFSRQSRASNYFSIPVYLRMTDFTLILRILLFNLDPCENIGDSYLEIQNY
jgi:hypothetical protein